MGFEIAIEINATERRVWEVLTDIEHWPEWTSSITSVTRIDSGALAIGSKARIKQPIFGTLTWTVTDFTPLRSFTWEAKTPGITVVAGHHLDSPDGKIVSLTLTVEQRGPIGRLVAPLAEKSARRFVQLEAEGHKRRAEMPG